MSTLYDVIVVGLGGHGSGLRCHLQKHRKKTSADHQHQHILTSAAAAHLSTRGSKVLGIDRYPRIHSNGSSHGRSRIIRLAYYEDHRCEFLC